MDGVDDIVNSGAYGGSVVVDGGVDGDRESSAVGVSSPSR